MDRKGKWFTKEEDAYILENYKSLGPEQIAKKLNRPQRTIEERWRICIGRKGAAINTSGERKIQFITAIKIIKNKNIKHENRIAGTMEAVRAGWLDDINIKVV